MNWKKLIHKHRWKLSRSFINHKETYAHEHFECECGKHKHIKHYWDKQPTIRIYKQTKQK
jgi:hypothetical protein